MAIYIRLIAYQKLKIAASNVVLKKMSPESSRLRSFFSRFATFLESLLIFILLLSGIGIIFVGKSVGQMGLNVLLLVLGFGVEIIAVIIISLYVYFRFLRQRGIETE